MVGNCGCCNILCVDVGSRNGVRCIFVECEFLKRDVVEGNALETVVDSVAAVTVTLELEVDVNG